MKILYLHQYFRLPCEQGGTRSYDLSSAFIKEGFQIIVVTSTSDEKYKCSSRWHIELIDGIEIHRIFLKYDNNLTYFKRTIVFLRFLLFSSFHLISIKADLVLATSTPLTIGIPALIKKWFCNTPYIFEVRDVWPEAVIAIGAIKNKLLQKVLSSLEWLIYKNAKDIVPLSTDMQKSIITRYPEFIHKTEIVIENIAEIDRFQDDIRRINFKEVIGINPRFSILYAGTFGKVNGLNKIVDLAVKILDLDPELVFIFIGSGAEKEKIIELAILKKVLNVNVFILDPVSKNELPIWYNSVSMGSSFVTNIPELWANSANKFFDTLAASKPILINYEGWQAKVIRERNTGYVLPYEIDQDSLKVFVEYTKNHSLIKEQQKQAITLAKEKFSLKLASEKYIKLFAKYKSGV